MLSREAILGVLGDTRRKPSRKEAAANNEGYAYCPTNLTLDHGEVHA